MGILTGRESAFNPIQKRIVSYVDAYKELFSEEYKNICEAIKAKRKGMVMPYGEFPGMKGDKGGIIVRKLGEIPATLHAIFTTRLTEEESKYLQSKTGARWFYKTFAEFRITKEI